MGKKIFTIAFAPFLFTIPGNSQNFTDSAIVAFGSSHIFSEVRNTRPFTPKEEFLKLSEKELGLNIYVYAVPEREYISDPSQAFELFYVLVKNDTILSVELSREKLKPILTTSRERNRIRYQYHDSAALKNYLDIYNKQFFSSHTINDLLGGKPILTWIFSPYSSLRNPQYSGDSSLTQMCRYVKAGNRAMLRKLASSFYGADRVYGVMGLHFLQKDGVQLTAEEEQLIRLNRLSNEKIWVIYGDHLDFRKKVREVFDDVFFLYGYELMKARKEI